MLYLSILVVLGEGVQVFVLRSESLLRHLY